MLTKTAELYDKPFMFHYPMFAAFQGGFGVSKLKLFETFRNFLKPQNETETFRNFLGIFCKLSEMPVDTEEVGKFGGDELDITRLRALGRKKPRTKAGQVRQAWPEIRQLLEAGHALKDVCAWLNEIGIEIGYARLCDYVNQLRRAQPGYPQAAPALEQAMATQTESEVDNNGGLKKRDPLANVRRSEARRPGFHYRPATPADEKDLI